MSRNIRSIYMGFGHDYPGSWEFLKKWQPSIVTAMVQGSFDDPKSVATNRIERIHNLLPECKILVRCWEVDDNNYERHEEMARNPREFAAKYHAWWDGLFDRIHVPRELLYGGAVNEPNPDEMGRELHVFTGELCGLGNISGTQFGVFRWSVGRPPLPGEDGFNWDYYADLEGVISEGGHLIVAHEYMQPEGSRFEWTDDQGRLRHDYGNLIGRHHSCPLECPIYIGEWGVDGLLFGRHPHPEYGNNGWRSFPHLWTPERLAQEYVWFCQNADPRVIGVAPFGDDIPGEEWWSFGIQPAQGALLAHRHLAVGKEDGGDVADKRVGEPPVEVEEPVTPAAGGVLDPYVLDAIVRAESAGKAFGPDGRITIRFEAHIFLRRVGGSNLFKHHPEQPWREQMFRVAPDAPWKPIHTGKQSTQYAALEVARNIGEDAALSAISMGLGQIMGFNAQRVGYPSAKAMFDHFYRSEPAQFLGIVNYMLSDPELMRAVQAKDWETIALLYNGSGNVEEVAGIYRRYYEEARG